MIMTTEEIKRQWEEIKQTDKYKNEMSPEHVIHKRRDSLDSLVQEGLYKRVWMILYEEMRQMRQSRAGTVTCLLYTSDAADE